MTTATGERKDRTISRPKRPNHGPLFTSVWLYSRKEWVVRMNDRGRAEFDRMMARYSNKPHLVLAAVAPGLFRRASAHHDPDAIAQAAILGLMDAVRCWKPEGGASLDTVMGFHIRQKVNLELRGKRTDPCHTLSLDRLAYVDDGDLNGVTVSSMVADLSTPPADHEAETADEVSQMEDLLRYLTPVYRRVLVGRFVEGMTLDEVGEELGVTRERVRQIQVKAVEAVRKKAGDENANGQVFTIRRQDDPRLQIVKRVQDERLEKVRRFLLDNPGRTLAEVVSGTGLPETVASNLLRKGARRVVPIFRCEGASQRFSRNPIRWFSVVQD